MMPTTLPLVLMLGAAPVAAPAAGPLRPPAVQRGATNIVTVHTEAPINELDRAFVSFTLDADQNFTHLPDFPYTDPTMRQLCAALGPDTLLRYGGTMEDYTFISNRSAPPNATTQTLSLAQFDALRRFATGFGWRLVFGLNARQRRNNVSPWVPGAVADLIRHANSDTAPGTKAVWWELGEPRAS